MFFDALTVMAVVDELREKLLGGRVQRVLQLSEHSLGCEIYAHHERNWLLLSAHPQNARVHIVPERLARGSEQVSPLLLLLRKYVRDGRLIQIEQPPLERILSLTFSYENEDQAGAFDQCRLIIEIMGRYSNIIMVDERDVVLESLKRVGPNVSRYRVVLPKQPYIAPPAQNKLVPMMLTASNLSMAMSDKAPATLIWQALVTTVTGMSPLLAREIAHRVTGDVGTPLKSLVERGALERLIAVMQGVYNQASDHLWAPTIARGATGIVAFAPYDLSHLPHRESCPSISEAAEAFYGELERFTSEEQEKERVRTQLALLRERHKRRREALQRSMTQGQEAERLRLAGEAVLASMGQLVTGQEQLEFHGRIVKIDPTISAAENARAYFREYKKAKAALAQVPELLAEEEAVLAYLDEAATHLDIANTVALVRRIRDELRVVANRQRGVGGYNETKTEKKGKKKSKPGKAKAAPRNELPHPFCVLADGYETYVGRSAKENEEITFHVANQDDLWLHARGVSGAHVVVRTRGRPVPEAVIERAARLAAGFSAGRNAGRVVVDYTLRKHVRHVRSGFAGLVTYSEEHTIAVAPDRRSDGQTSRETKSP